jgi:ATP-binding cassette subfamily B protein
VMALPVPLLLFAIYSHGERMKKLFLKAWRKWSNVTSVLSDTIPGIQVVKAFNQEKKEEARFNQCNEIVTNEFNNIHNEWTKFWPLLMLGFQLILLSVWIFAMPRLISERGSEDALSAGTFVSFLLYMTMFSQPIEILGQVARMLNRALSSAYRIFEVLDTKASIVDKENPLKLNELKGNVEFKNVFFSYDGVRPILQDLNFNVKAGEMIGLVGSSGGGKSTITKLIARFYDVNGGQILIDGHPLKDLEMGGYRKQVGMVLQEPYLFHGSIWDNIAYGVPNASAKEVIEAAKIANAHNFIGRLHLGYDTVIGERGHTLSGGERQRISIARAVLANPRILILDEATSAVDTETERKIQDALDKLIEGRTVFAVAHRLSTLRKADRIFVIGKGSITEQGTHSELLKINNGEYARLHRMQQEMSEEFIV